MLVNLFANYSDYSASTKLFVPVQLKVSPNRQKNWIRFQCNRQFTNNYR